MIVPLHDNRPFERIVFPYVTVGLMTACGIAFLASNLEILDEGVVASLGAVPAKLFPASNAAANLDRGSFPPWLTPLTYMFFHSGIEHIIGNMLFLWVFGDNVEDALGHVRFLFFYLACGASGAVFHAALATGRLGDFAPGGALFADSEMAGTMPLIGASAAVCGVAVAYVVFYPRAKIWALWFFAIPIRSWAAVPIVAYIAFQIVMLFHPISDTTAYCAHIGGFAAGLALVPLLRPRTPSKGEPRGPAR